MCPVGGEPLIGRARPELNRALDSIADETEVLWRASEALEVRLSHILREQDTAIADKEDRTGGMTTPFAQLMMAQSHSILQTRRRLESITERLEAPIPDSPSPKARS